MVLSIGDLAHSFSNRAANLRIRTELNTLAQELTTGRKSDLREALRGDMAPVVLIERQVATLAAHDRMISESELFVAGMQNALGQVSGGLDTMAKAAFDMENTGDPSLIANFGASARERLTATVNLLNGGIGGRALFAGADTGVRAIADADAILDDLMALLPPDAEAQQISAVTDAYFAAGGAFETTRYLGSGTPLAPFRVTPGDALTLDVTARTDELRQALGAMAKAALLDRGVPTTGVDEQRGLIRIAGLALVGAGAAVASLRGEVGILEGRFEEARARNATERATLEFARAGLVTADPFETASRLSEVQTQLETFFTVTARLSTLNLTGYLR